MIFLRSKITTSLTKQKRQRNLAELVIISCLVFFSQIMWHVSAIFVLIAVSSVFAMIHRFEMAYALMLLGILFLLKAVFIVFKGARSAKVEEIVAVNGCATLEPSKFALAIFLLLPLVIFALFLPYLSTSLKGSLSAGLIVLSSIASLEFFLAGLMVNTLKLTERLHLISKITMKMKSKDLTDEFWTVYLAQISSFELDALTTLSLKIRQLDVASLLSQELLNSIGEITHTVQLEEGEGTPPPPANF